jgi:hypothetical protein
MRKQVVRERTTKYHYLALCVYQLMEAGERRGDRTGVLLCTCDSKANFLGVHKSLKLKPIINKPRIKKNVLTRLTYSHTLSSKSSYKYVSKSFPGQGKREGRGTGGRGDRGGGTALCRVA